MYKILLRSALAAAFSVALAFGVLSGATLGAGAGRAIAPSDSGWDIVHAASPAMDSGWDSAQTSVQA